MRWLCAIFNWIIDPDNLTAISTFTIAIFTIVLACVTRRQAILTKKAINISERALHDLERACIVPAFPKPVERDAEEFGPVRGVSTPPYTTALGLSASITRAWIW
jgi:hypothetical protein